MQNVVKVQRAANPSWGPTLGGAAHCSTTQFYISNLIAEIAAIATTPHSSPV